jgi:hypothetical protein
METRVSQSETGVLQVLLECDRKWPSKSKYTCQIDRNDQPAWFTATVPAPKRGPISIHLPLDERAASANDGQYAVRWFDGNGTRIEGALRTFKLKQGVLSTNG